MPSGPDPTAAAQVVRSPLSRLLRWTGIAIVATIATFCVLLLAVRYVALPRVESHRDDIAQWLSRELGRPVEIDGIVTGWDGWNPRIAVHGLRVFDRARAAPRPLVELPDVSGTISWTSLLLADLRLRELSIAAPKLAVRRDVDGRLQIAGFEIDPGAVEGDSALTDWLLRQRLIVVRNALVSWNDDRRNAPQLILDDVHFRLENRFGQHRFGLTGTPPADVGAPIDLRGEVGSAALADWRTGSGRLYLRLDYANVAAWTEWLPIPIEIMSGQGAVRVWFDFDDGVASNVVADVEVADVRTRLARDLPALDLAHVTGRLTWRQHGDRRSLSARALSLVMPDGTSIVPGDADLHYQVAADGTPSGGRFVAGRLELAPLTTLAVHLPLPERLREDLSRYAARGSVSDAEYVWDGPLTTPTSFRTRGSFTGLAVNARESMPGLAGVSGTFEANEASGSLDIAGQRMAVLLPRVFAEPLLLDTASARVRWTRERDGVNVRLDDVQFANAHAAGSAQGTWRSRGGGPGEIDLTAQLRRADARQLHRYIPLAVGPDTRQWVRDSLLAGRSDDAKLTLKGDLSQFPFADGKSGTFLVVAKASDATLDYANGWPRITGLDAEVRFAGNGLRVDATRGQVLGASLSRTSAAIADMSLAHPVVTVTGEAAGPTGEFLRFIESSPLVDWMDRFTVGAQSTGDGRLAMRFALELGKADAVAQVAGDYQFTDNTLRLPGVPPLARLGGQLSFTERELSGGELRFDALGGSGRASLASKDGTLRVSAEGTARLDAVQRELGTAISDRVSGTTDWQLQLSSRRSAASWTVTSSLRGVTVDLPVPLGKHPDETIAMRGEHRPAADGGRETFAVDYGTTARIVVQRRPGADVDRALVLLGKAASARGSEPDRAGIVVRGDTRSVNVDEWLALAREPAPRASTAPAPAAHAELQAVDIEAADFIALGRRWDDMTLSGRRSGDGWRMSFASKQLEGKATWEPAGSKLANGRFSAQLSRLELAKMDEVRSQPDPAKAARPAAAANPWPEIEVVADRYLARAGNLGRMELSARPEGPDWRVTRFALVNDAGRIDADGWWRAAANRQQTRFDVRIDVRDSGAFLRQMGLPGDVKGAPAKLDGQIEWPGSPTDFEYPALSGTFKVVVGAGQFTRLDPGMGKLLGVLSLQALPRRITLDFRDVFSEGFAFDTFNGTVTIAQGVMRTEDLTLSGPAAKVHLSGEVDLERETQRIAVRVQPSLSTVVSTGAGAAAVALLAANPLVGAAVGAGALLAQKLMQDPIEQMFSYDYAVRGSWSEPVVERVAARPFQRLGEAAPVPPTPR